MLHILALFRMSVTYLTIVRQECRTSYQFLLNAQIHAVRSINLFYTIIAAATINLIVAVAIVLLNLYIAT